MKSKCEAFDEVCQMERIDDGCRNLALQRSRLQAVLENIQQEQLEVAKRHATKLKAEVGALAQLKAKVAAMVAAARGLFVRPKSREFHGITVGFAKARDTMNLPEAGMLIQRIRDLLPAKAALLIHQPEPVVRLDALKGLSRDELQSLGVSWTTGADSSFVRLGKTDPEAEAESLLAAISNQQSSISNLQSTIIKLEV